MASFSCVMRSSATDSWLTRLLLLFLAALATACTLYLAALV